MNRIWIAGLLIFAACGSEPNKDIKNGEQNLPPVETTEEPTTTNKLSKPDGTVLGFDSLDLYVGEDIVIQGTVTNTKIPSIRGISIDAADGHRNECVVASGILSKKVVTQADLDELDKDGIVQHGGPGTEYWMSDAEIRKCDQ